MNLLPIGNMGIMMPMAGVISGGGGGGGVPVIDSFTLEVGSGGVSRSGCFEVPPVIDSGDLCVLAVAFSHYGAGFNAPAATRKCVTYSAQAMTRSMYTGSAVEDVRVAGFTREATGGEDDGKDQEVTWSGTGSDARSCGIYMRITGANSAAPVDVISAQVNAATTSHQIPGVTTNVDNCLVLAIFAFEGGDASDHTVSIGWTIVGQVKGGVDTYDANCLVAYKEMASAGATGDCTVTSDVSDGSAVGMIAIKPAP